MHAIGQHSDTLIDALADVLLDIHEALESRNGEGEAVPALQDTGRFDRTITAAAEIAAAASKKKAAKKKS